jgi:hypothetical protein
MSDCRRTVPWTEALSALPHEPMASLVQFLASPRYGRSLFPCIVEGALLVGRTPDFAAGSGELQIRFDAELQQFSFTHLQRADDPDPWTRECAAGEWRQVLERILHKRLQWFHEG